MMKKREKGVVKKAAKAAALSHFEKYIHAATKWDKGFWMSVIFDYAYLITLYGVFTLFLVLLQATSTPLWTAIISLARILFIIGPAGELSHGLETIVDTILNSLVSSVFLLTLLFLGALFVFLAITSLYKAYIWLHLTKQKHTLAYVRKFVIWNILWQLLWLAVAVIIFLGFTPAAAAAALFLELACYLYFTAFFRSLLTEKHTMKQLWKETFVLGSKKFPHFIIPGSLMLITVVFSMWIVIILMNLIAPFALSLVGLALFIFVAFSWVRFYFYLNQKEVAVCPEKKDK